MVDRKNFSLSEIKDSTRRLSNSSTRELDRELYQSIKEKINPKNVNLTLPSLNDPILERDYIEFLEVYFKLSGNRILEKLNSPYSPIFRLVGTHPQLICASLSFLKSFELDSNSNRLVMLIANRILSCQTQIQSTKKVQAKLFELSSILSADYYFHLIVWLRKKFDMKGNYTNKLVENHKMAIEFTEFVENNISKPDTVIRYAEIVFREDSDDWDMTLHFAMEDERYTSKKPKTKFINTSIRKSRLETKQILFLSAIMITDYLERIERNITQPVKISYEDIASLSIWKHWMKKTNGEEQSLDLISKDHFMQIKNKINQKVHLEITGTKKNSRAEKNNCFNLIESDYDSFWINTLEPSLPLNTEWLIELLV